MRKKAISFGLGMGIVLMTALFFLLYGFQIGRIEQQTAIKQQAAENLAEETLKKEQDKLATLETEVAVLREALEKSGGAENGELLEIIEGLSRSVEELKADKANSAGQGTEPDAQTGPSQSPQADPSQSYQGQGSQESSPLSSDNGVANNGSGNNNDNIGENVGTEAEMVEIFIPVGSHATTVCDLLAERGLVDNSQAFRNYLARTSNTANINAGEFRIPKGLSYEELLRYLRRLQ